MAKNTKILHLRVYCQAFYDSTIEVPEDMDLETAFRYAEEHIDEIPMTNMEYISDSDEVDSEDLDNKKYTYFTDC